MAIRKFNEYSDMSKTSHLKLVRISRHGPPATGEELAVQLAPADRDSVRTALVLAEPLYGDSLLPSGEPALNHALGVAAIATELGLDGEAVAAALLAPVAIVAPERMSQLRERCGAAVADLVEGVARMAHIHALSAHSASASRREGQDEQLEALRKMLLAMVQDIRVVLVKLADHLQALRYSARSGDAETQRGTARLTGDIFAPLANRLGVWQLKWEMEDLAFRMLEPQTYRRIAQLLDGKRGDRERYIEDVIGRVSGELARAGIAAEVTGRPKHIFSIYKKMNIKGIDFESLYDVRAVRILVEDVKDCYGVLGLVHNVWTPIPKGFDDYIAKPKSNQYRSLHTSVIGPEDKALEVQIRTRDMHQHSELGVAAHWRYKEGTRREQNYDHKIAWLRQILEWKDDARDAGELAARFRTGLFEDTVYVLTPQGRVIALPKGATPVDFAYQVHTELGHRCRGARVDGAMVPLSTPLANGQRIEILPAKLGGPSRDWLNPALGYVRSSATRLKIKQWFNRRNAETAAARGRAVVEKALQREGLTSLNLDRLAGSLGYATINDFFAAVGRGEIGPRQLQTAARAADPRARLVPAAAPEDAPGAAAPGARAPTRKGGVLVVGVDRLLTVPARCCKPAPPDAITGFVTLGRGVTIHRANCASLQRLDARRRVAAEWGGAAGATFPVDIAVEAKNRTGVLRDVADALARGKARIAGSRSVKSDGGMRLRYTIEISDLGQLSRVLALVREVRGVARAVRR